MVFYPFEVTIPHIIYACLGGFVVLFGMFSLFMRERLYIGEACWAFLFGVIIGPYCANIFDPRSWGDTSDATTNVITLEFTRVVLAIGVFAIGVELPKAYMARHWKSLFFLLFPIMTWGWFVCAGLIYAFVPGLTFLSSLAVAACLTPTDPILAAAVVGGKWADKHVPAHIRHLLAAESGCNDGAAYPFLFIALFLTLDKSTGHAVRDWFLLLWLYQVTLAIVIGGLLGFAFRHLMKFCQRRDLIDRHSYVAQYVSLAMLTIGVCTLLGSDDLLAAFACGTAFAWDGFFNRQTEESVFSSVIDLLFNIAAFVFVGAWMPFSKFQDAALTLTVWRLIVIAVLVLLLRRLPILIALYKFIPDVKTFRESLFVGHFGPIGIGAVYISTLAAEILHDGYAGEHAPHDPQIVLLQGTIQPIVGFMVLCSITIHGLSIPSFSLGRRVHSVSRTWSRRDTAEAPPDWTNQTRRITRGEEIVINRDRVDMMEKGVLVSTADKSDDKDRKIAESSSSDVQIEADEGLPKTEDATQKQIAEQAQGETDEGSAETKVTPAGESLRKGKKDYREEAPPDGEEDYMEWIEPHHRVIERRKGPGADVNVEVLDTDGKKTRRSPSSLNLKRFASKWTGEPSTSAKEGKTGTSKKVHHEVEKVEQTLRDVGDSAKEGMSSLKGASTTSDGTTDGSENDGDEEGWASETSDNGEQETVIDVSAKAQGKKRTRTGSTRKARLRPARHSLPSSYPRSTPHSSDVDDSVEESRGRSPVDISGAHGNPRRAIHQTSREGSGSLRPRTTDSIRPRTADSIRHHRLESIRAQYLSLSREASPSRSVRFVDEPGDPGGNRSARASRIWDDTQGLSRDSGVHFADSIDKADSSESSTATSGNKKR